jgi:hypothetical protein
VGETYTAPTLAGCRNETMQLMRALRDARAPVAALG